MMPMMSSMTLFLTIVENRKMRPMTVMAPAKAAANTAMKPVTLTEPTDSEPPMPSMTRATPTPAPLLIPKMLGPASGFLNAVCSIRPLTASEPPQRVAVIACGSRLSIMMKCHEGRWASCPVRMLTTSFSGIDTDPTARFSANSTSVSTVSRQHITTPRFTPSVSYNNAARTFLLCQDAEFV